MKTLIIKTVIALYFVNFSKCFRFDPCPRKIYADGYFCCGYLCDQKNPIYTDEDGIWGVENNEWCLCTQFLYPEELNECSEKITNLGFKCCPKDCKVIYSDEYGTWGLYGGSLCGCTQEQDSVEDIYNKYNDRVKAILDDDKEIERKWLIDINKIPYDLSANTVFVENIKQTYICFDPEIRVREYSKRHMVTYEMTIKTNLSEDGLIRDEVNIDINMNQYENMLKKQEGDTIYKTRYQFYADGEVIAIDIFHDDLEGLAYMEIEFPTKEDSDAYVSPDWVIKEVTDDIRFKNGYLARYGAPEVYDYKVNMV